MEEHFRNAPPTTFSHQLHWWKGPRWIVIRIETLTVVAIIFSFFLAAFGSCRRWSNSWIVQKGFLAAQVLSLSLGTYSIGLMQSSSVKSEMYPVWTVLLFTLFGCIDPVTTYNGLDYKGPLSKMVYGICLNCGYVLLMSITTLSNVFGNTAIITLSAITFMKSFHRSFAFVEQKKLCDMMDIGSDDEGHIFIRDRDSGIGDDIEQSISYRARLRLQSCYDMWVALCLSHKLRRYILGLDYHVPRPGTLQNKDLKWALKLIEIELALVYDAFFTSNPFLHHYQARTASLWALASFAGICFVLVATAIPGGMTRHFGAIGCTEVVRTTTANLAITFGILVSLALLQLTQLVQSWTSNWARAAVVCACMDKDKEIIPEQRPFGRMKQRGHLKPSGWVRLKVLVATSTNMFDKYLWQDKISQYSMLQEPRLLAHGERKGEPMWGRLFCLMKKWGRLLTGGERKGDGISSSTAEGGPKRKRCVDFRMLGLHYIWKVIWELLSNDTNKRGDVKLDEDVKASIPDPERISSSEIEGERVSSIKTKGEWISKRCVDMVHTLGLHYFWQVIWELLTKDTNKRGGVKLDEDVKGSIIDFIGQLEYPKVNRIWLSSLPEEPQIRHFLRQFISLYDIHVRPEDHCYRYVSCVMTWHIATWYCELEEQKKLAEADAPICCGRETAASYYLQKAVAAIRRPGIYFQRRAAAGRGGGRGGGGGTKTRDHRHVANVLSQYCAYLVKSTPELLPGPVAYAKRVYHRFAREVKIACNCNREGTNTIPGNISDRGCV